MPADKIDVARLAQEADTHATVKYAPFHTKEWCAIRDEHFARLVMEGCAKAVMMNASCSACGEDAANRIKEMMP